MMRMVKQSFWAPALTWAVLAGVASHAAAMAEDPPKEQKDSQKPTVIWEAPKKGKPQPPASPLMKSLQAAQAAMQKEQWAEAITELNNAKALPGRLPQDDFQIDEMLGYAYIKAGKYAEGGAAFETALNSGQMPADKVGERVQLLTQLYYEIKNYPKAIEYGQRWIGADGVSSPDVYVLVGQSQYLTEDFRNSIQSIQKAIDLSTQQGKGIKENWLQIQLSGYAKLQDNAGIQKILERLAIEFPQKSNWQDLFNVLQRQYADDERTMANVLRLKFEAGLLKTPEEYFQMAQSASRTGLPGEAIKVLEQGRAKKVFTSEIDIERSRQMLQDAKVAAATDRKTLAVAEKESRAAKTGEADVQLGIAYLSYDDYEKGIEAIQRGLQKGKLKRPDEAQIMLGRGLLKLNRKADAQAAFDRVEPTAKLGTIARMWKIYSDQPSWLSS